MQIRLSRTMHTKLSLVVAVVMCLALLVRAEDPQQNVTISSTLLNAALCPATADPWACGKMEMANMLDIIESELDQSKQLIKNEADAELQRRIQRREFSESEVPKEKPSTVMTTMDNYVRNSLDSFMSRKKHDDDKKKKKKKKKKPETSSVQYVHVKPLEHDYYGHDDHEDDDDKEPNQHALAHQHGGHLNNGHHGHNHGGLFRPPHFKKKHGRDIGEVRGHKKGKKKIKKAIMKLLLIGAVLKAKLEFLLKILATHLQIKFFIVAVLGLAVNIGRFWFDLKKGHNPQKVIYYEHAQHQHHYDEHDEGGWGGSGGYWKRSFDTQDAADPDVNAGVADDLRLASVNDPEHIAYRNQVRV